MKKKKGTDENSGNPAASSQGKQKPPQEMRLIDIPWAKMLLTDEIYAQNAEYCENIHSRLQAEAEKAAAEKAAAEKAEAEKAAASQKQDKIPVTIQRLTEKKKPEKISFDDDWDWEEEIPDKNKIRDEKGAERDFLNIVLQLDKKTQNDIFLVLSGYHIHTYEMIQRVCFRYLELLHPPAFFLKAIKSKMTISMPEDLKEKYITLSKELFEGESLAGRALVSALLMLDNKKTIEIPDEEEERRVLHEECCVPKLKDIQNMFLMIYHMDPEEQKSLYAHFNKQWSGFAGTDLLIRRGDILGRDNDLYKVGTFCKKWDYDLNRSNFHNTVGKFLNRHQEFIVHIESDSSEKEEDQQEILMERNRLLKLGVSLMASFFNEYDKKKQLELEKFYQSTLNKKPDEVLGDKELCSILVYLNAASRKELENLGLMEDYKRVGKLESIASYIVSVKEGLEQGIEHMKKAVEESGNVALWRDRNRWIHHKMLPRPYVAPAEIEDNDFKSRLNLAQVFFEDTVLKLGGDISEQVRLYFELFQCEQRKNCTLFTEMVLNAIKYPEEQKEELVEKMKFNNHLRDGEVVQNPLDLLEEPIKERLTAAWQLLQPIKKKNDFFSSTLEKLAKNIFSEIPLDLKEYGLYLALEVLLTSDSGMWDLSEWLFETEEVLSPESARIMILRDLFQGQPNQYYPKVMRILSERTSCNLKVNNNQVEFHKEMDIVRGMFETVKSNMEKTLNKNRPLKKFESTMYIQGKEIYFKIRFQKNECSTPHVVIETMPESMQGDSMYNMKATTYKKRMAEFEAEAFQEFAKLDTDSYIKACTELGLCIRKENENANDTKNWYQKGYVRNWQNVTTCKFVDLAPLNQVTLGKSVEFKPTEDLKKFSK